jgi:hypothetical protein
MTRRIMLHRVMAKGATTMTTTAVLDTTLVTAAPRRLSAMVRQQADTLSERVDEARDRVRRAFTDIADRILHALAIPTSRDIGQLSERLARIEVEVSRLTGKKLVAQKSVKRAPGASAKAPRPPRAPKKPA